MSQPKKTRPGVYDITKGGKYIVMPFKCSIIML